MRQCLAPSLSTIDCSLWWENLVDEGKGGYQDQNVAIDLEMVAAEIYPREPGIYICLPSGERLVRGYKLRKGGSFSCAFRRPEASGKIVESGIKYT